MTTHTTTETRTAEQWWTWHDADAERWSPDEGDAEARCAAWVAGESDDGPEAQPVTVSRVTETTRPAASSDAEDTKLDDDDLQEWENCAAQAGDAATMLIAGIARREPADGLCEMSAEEIEEAWPTVTCGSSGEEIVALCTDWRRAKAIADSWGSPWPDDDGPEAQPVTVSRITVGTATETTTGVDGGVDVDVTVTLSDGAELSGEVTLVPDRAAPGEWRPYGDEPSMWVEHTLLDGLGRCDDLTAALSAIESDAAEEARRR